MWESTLYTGDRVITLNVNGVTHEYDDTLAKMPLLWLLRDNLGLTGTKYGCGRALCGACTVHIGDEAARSCSIMVGDAAAAFAADNKKTITTIEAVSGRVAEAVQDAWRALNVVQCGYCQSGQIMSAITLLNAIPHPTDKDIDLSMDGNICRCGTYHRIRAAIHEAADKLGGKMP
jgi:isoquinoline 1-oxidoreductase alpha subunit